MNNTESSSTERLIAHALIVAGEEILDDASGRFPSCLRVFGNFFQSCAAKSNRGAAKLLCTCCVRLSLGPAYVAFV